jgi:hypothetical protein
MQEGRLLPCRTDDRMNLHIQDGIVSHSNMEAVGLWYVPSFCLTTWCFIIECRNCCSHGYGNLKSHGHVSPK